MALQRRDITTMDDLFIHLLRDIYYAKKQVEAALGRFARKANDALLRQALVSYGAETSDQTRRLETLFALLGQQARPSGGPVIDTLVEEGEMIVGDADNASLQDMMLINAVQAVTHYGSARYGSLLIWARQRDNPRMVELLQASLDEDKVMDRKLTTLAMIPPLHLERVPAG